ncbi:MAG TPA: helix-turn-helix domain-containing protein [Gammaproteobacteria bacterium]|nr:helix-turn-helix domain-containing protein [Gammaproteobacteria bacterium]
MKRNHNHRLIKIHRSYTVEEIASLLNTHKNTIRAWIKDGLSTTDSKRPLLVQGRDLAVFLQARRLKNKQKCNCDEMYCVKCHLPRVPAGDLVEYKPYNEKIGNLIAICPYCHSIMNRRVSLAKLKPVFGKSHITFPPLVGHIDDSNQATTNSYFREDVEKC